MKILFLHPNFPGQFKNCCRHFAEQKNEVKFICQTHYNRTIKNVDRLTIKCEGGHEAFLKNTKDVISRLRKRSEYYRSAFEILKIAGWEPDLVVTHTGWGCGVNIKEIWPKTKIIAYLEWWFHPESELIAQYKANKYGDYNEDLEEILWERNILISFELSMADQIIAPTNWQKRQMPEPLQKNCQVIFDGVDSEIFKFDYNNISKIPKITYGTRGMEEMRCFPEFIKSLPLLLKKWPSLKVEIAGEDKICYAGCKPSEGSWGSWAKNYLKEHKVDKNVKWVGRLDLDNYIKWLQSSWCHVYLTQPYIVSWSLVETIFCQTPLVVNKNNAVKEFCDYIPEIEYIETIDPSAIVNAISKQLRNTISRPFLPTQMGIEKLVEWEAKHCENAWMGVAKKLVDQC